MRYDAIVIGSGMGGLTTAAALAKSNKRVLVLEAHDRLGGYIHSFKRKQWEWNIGTHYMGKNDPETPIGKLFGVLTGNAVQFEYLGDRVDVVKYPGFDMALFSKIDEMAQKLTEMFPEEAEQVRKYFDLVGAVGSKMVAFAIPRMVPMPVSNLVFNVVALPFWKYRNKTVKEVVDSHFRGNDLRRFFYYTATKTGIDPETSSFFYYAIVQWSMKDGVSYPSGSGDAIVQGMVDVIERNGGEIRKRSEVKEIVVENGAVAGVRCGDGSTLYGDTVISNIGMKETATRLLSPALLPKGYVERLSRHRLSHSYITLFIGLEGDIREVGADHQNYRLFFGDPLKGLGDPTDPKWHPGAVSIAFQTLRDKTKRNGLHHTCEVIVLSDYAPFARWEDQQVNRRDDAYKALKQRLQGILLKVLAEQFPGIDRYIKYMEVGTPLTYAHYCRHESGAGLGMHITPEKFRDMTIRPDAPIKGLYYTGADIIGYGILGTFISGVTTASKITGINFFKNPPRG